MPRLRLALAQTNPIVGDLEGNSVAIIDAVRRARDAGADLVAFGEMALSGYPIEDLAGRPSFLAACRRRAAELAAELGEAGLGDVVVVLGHPDGPFEPRRFTTSNAPTAIAQNVASVIQGGAIVARYAKHHLPNYSVFDEYRIFIPGDELLVLRMHGVDVALIICEDLWQDGGPVNRVASADAGLLLVINASPYERDKNEVRLPLVTRRAVENDTCVAYVNIVGGQDDLLFDGDSVVVDRHGRIVARAPQFQPHLLVVDLDLEGATEHELPENVALVELAAPASGHGDGGTAVVVGDSGTPRDAGDADNAGHASDVGDAGDAAESAGDGGRTGALTPLTADIAVVPDELEQIWGALVLGLGDYVRKNGFGSVILGLSGGIDSSVVASMAADAIGASKVYGVSMPSQWSSDHSRSDADDLAERIGLHYETQAIAELVAPIESQLQLDGVAAENLQARIRGIILMGLSNQKGHLVLTTGNKSELAVGYSTIYGDSVGGFAPLKDVPKMLVWELARWRNTFAERRGETPPIPENSISKPPSAELRPDQTDQDSLPEYDVLDALLEQYINGGLGRTELIEHGFDAPTVDRIISLVDHSEWKRRQSAIGTKISRTAFGRDRRLPITYRPTDVS
ncbi:NAD+ synthase [Subtercola lobariae]|uniref:Glutamine-dependent NAD(+) synthetase n=1 Tax=Subtercola lobariae TaxID=1588641 RepID=A0A917B5U7_9MICO|nr:NAD+ synthase [Subtercola lobariae]GGF24197.1 NAD+ synthase (glutamine-hydrolysing) [Subtercola lobariae]